MRRRSAAVRDWGGHSAGDLIFVAGLPKAASILLEQILLSHSRVDGTLELPNILSWSQQLQRSIFRPGLDYWRNYEPGLGPLRDALGEAVLGHNPMVA